jgi:pimeloyl-ACP methyl ester carboxylesterase
MTTARNGDCELHHETFGDPADPALLMVNGLGSQCINFHEELVAMFVATGLFVIRFDNRDVGLSTSFAGAPVGERGNAYVLSDMAADAIAVLDAAGVERAHVMGVSMGGMIVQTLAIEHPERLLTMTSIMSNTGEPGYGRSAPEAFSVLTSPPAADRESFVGRHIAGLRIWGSPAFADEQRWRRDAERAFDRSFRPDGTARQFVAIGASPPRAEQLRHVSVPTLVVHGDRDTLIDPSGGRRTAELVPGARFELIEGMGHDYPPQLWPRWVELIGGFVHSHEPRRSR